ncbi:MAG TPA: hypothetical protein VEC99_11015 [Clostridia bacterium]|nr:hypothetical protein [Clostridia bacterium]
MRRLLRNRNSRKFVSNGQWTSDQSLARDFSDAFQAIETCHRLGLMDMEMVLQVDAEPSALYDISIPVGNSMPTEDRTQAPLWCLPGEEKIYPKSSLF